MNTTWKATGKVCACPKKADVLESIAEDGTITRTCQECTKTWKRKKPKTKKIYES